MQPALATLERQADLIDSDQLSALTPPADLPLGTPAAYWLDLRDYNPTQLAATLHKPVLILQGGRDDQSTVDDTWLDGKHRSRAAQRSRSASTPSTTTCSPPATAHPPRLSTSPPNTSTKP